MKDAFKRGYGIFWDNTTWEDVLSCNPDLHIDHIIKEHMGTKKRITDNTPRKQRPTPRTNPKPAKRAIRPKGHERFNDVPTPDKQTRNLTDRPQSQPITLAEHK